jgi:hypothetical protein
VTLTGKQPLARDQRGTVLIIGVFGAALLIGGLYYLAGVNDASRVREHLQDTADAAAWNAAVMHARGMNLVALLNMAKLSAVAVTTSLLAIMFGAAQTILWIRSSRRRRLRYGYTIPSLILIFVQALSSYQGAQSRVADIVQAAERAQDALRVDLPEIAELRAMETAGSGFGPPALSAFTERPYMELPIRRGSTFDLCGQRSGYSDPPGQAAWVAGDTYSVHWPAYSIVERAFRSVPSGTVRSRAREEARSVLDAFCQGHQVTAREVAGKLGQEPFQLRYYAVGQEFPSAATEAGVRIATWGADEDGGRIRQLRDLVGRVAAAQAEFFFDGDEREEQFLWQMAWRPRLRRLRLPGGAQSFTAGCQEAGAPGVPCEELGEMLDELKGALVH